jgi:hypothetical protein
MRLAATFSAREQYVEAEQHAAIGYRVLRALPGSSAVELVDARTLLGGIYKKLGLPEKRNALESDTAAPRASSRQPKRRAESCLIEPVAELADEHGKARLARAVTGRDAL